MTTKANSPVKYQHIRDNLEAAIRNGEFAAGDQFPAEQALADRFGVSYLTARRAVCELVEADLLERRARKGTFVRSSSAPRSTTTLSLITSSYEHSLMREFISRGTRLAEREGWQPNVIRLSAGQQDAAVRAIRGGDLALVLLDEIQENSALARAMRAARGKAICLGSPTMEVGVPCILNDPTEVFQASVDHLVSTGHQKIAFVCQGAAESTSCVKTQAWCEATSALFTAEEAQNRCLRVQTPLFRCPTQDAYDAVSDFLTAGRAEVTAFLSFGEEITQGVLAAIRDSGRSVPEDISVLNMMDGPSMRFAHPPVTSIDMNFKRQFEIAFEILDAARGGAVPEQKMHFVETRVIERNSLLNLNLALAPEA